MKRVNMKLSPRLLGTLNAAIARRNRSDNHAAALSRLRGRVRDR